MSTRIPTSIWIPVSFTVALAACSTAADGGATWTLGGTTADAVDTVDGMDSDANAGSSDQDSAGEPAVAPPDLPVNCYGVGCPDGWNCNLTTFQCEAPCDAHSDCGAGLDCRPDRFCGCVAPKVDCFGTCCTPEVVEFGSGTWNMALDGTDTLHAFTLFEDGRYDYRWGPLFSSDTQDFEGTADLSAPVTVEDFAAIGPQRAFVTVEADGQRAYLRRTDYDTFRVIPATPDSYADVALHTDNQLRAAWSDGDTVMLASEDNGAWTAPTALPAEGGMALLSRPQGVALVTVADAQLTLRLWDDASGGYVAAGAVEVEGQLVEAIATSSGTPMAVFGDEQIYTWRDGVWQRSTLIVGIQGLHDARFDADGNGHALFLRYGSSPVYVWQDGPDAPWRLADVAYPGIRWLGLRLEDGFPMLVGWHIDYNDLVGVSYITQGP